jgi:hypothetical protein
MPKIERWSGLPPAIRRHLIERMRDRRIGLADLNQLRVWMETHPETPSGEWYRNFSSAQTGVRLEPDAQLPKELLFVAGGVLDVKNANTSPGILAIVDSVVIDRKGTHACSQIGTLPPHAGIRREK